MSWLPPRLGARYRPPRILRVIFLSFLFLASFVTFIPRIFMPKWFDILGQCNGLFYWIVLGIILILGIINLVYYFRALIAYDEGKTRIPIKTRIELIRNARSNPILQSDRRLDLPPSETEQKQSIEKEKTTKSKQVSNKDTEKLHDYQGKTNGKKCAICKLAFDEEEQILQCPHCGAYFHISHIYRWLKDNNFCPICKKIIHF
ncbi:MAG: RING finger domain-containing protein [Asgard group archaeon]|nr:RING finger domain-containing protein [Asgard group archaeon]